MTAKLQEASNEDIPHIAAAFCFISGFFTSIGATTVFQQIIGGISFLMSAIYFSGGAIVGSIETIGEQLNPPLPRRS